MNNYSVNPYWNSQRQNSYGFGQKVEVVSVNGENDAYNYPIPPNSSILMLDSTKPIVWLKTTDALSYPTLNGYEIKPIQTAPIVPTDEKHNYTKLEERIANLERRLDRGKSNTGNIAKPQSKLEQSE